MTVAAWILGGVLVMCLTTVGIMVLLMSRNRFMVVMGVKADWSDAVPQAVYKLSGVFEIVGALGIALPSITKVAPNVTSLSALGLVVLMSIAIGVHLGMRDRGNSVYKPIGLAVGLIALLILRH